jgi:anti-sigma regulatory factor (Ser/Thr protein kinase)
LRCVAIRPAELLRVRLRSDSSAPRRARNALEQLTEIEPVREDVLLVASELTTNAVKHSGVGAHAEIELCAELIPDGGLLISVTDAGRSASVPQIRSHKATKPGGFGLPIVESVSRRWGSERRRGTRVWAELSL